VVGLQHRCRRRKTASGTDRPSKTAFESKGKRAAVNWDTKDEPPTASHGGKSAGTTRKASNRNHSQGREKAGAVGKPDSGGKAKPDSGGKAKPGEKASLIARSEGKLVAKRKGNPRSMSNRKSLAKAELIPRNKGKRVAKDNNTSDLAKSKKRARDDDDAAAPPAKRRGRPPKSAATIHDYFRPTRKPGNRSKSSKS
jgi:hypothetical protein